MLIWDVIEIFFPYLVNFADFNNNNNNNVNLISSYWVQSRPNRLTECVCLSHISSVTHYLDPVLTLVACAKGVPVKLSINAIGLFSTSQYKSRYL